MKHAPYRSYPTPPMFRGEKSKRIATHRTNKKLRALNKQLLEQRIHDEEVDVNAIDISCFDVF